MIWVQVQMRKLSLSRISESSVSQEVPKPIEKPQAAQVASRISLMTNEQRGSKVLMRKASFDSKIKPDTPPKSNRLSGLASANFLGHLYYINSISKIY